MRRRLVRSLLPRLFVPSQAIIRSIAKFNVQHFDRGLKVSLSLSLYLYVKMHCILEED